MKELIIAGWKIERGEGREVFMNNTSPEDYSGALLSPNEESIEGSLLYRLLSDALEEAGI